MPRLENREQPSPSVSAQSIMNDTPTLRERQLPASRSSVSTSSDNCESHLEPAIIQRDEGFPNAYGTSGHTVFRGKPPFPSSSFQLQNDPRPYLQSETRDYNMYPPVSPFEQRLSRDPYQQAPAQGNPSDCFYLRGETNDFHDSSLPPSSPVPFYPSLGRAAISSKSRSAARVCERRLSKHNSHCLFFFSI